MPVIGARLQPVVIPTRRHDQFHLRRLIVADMEFLERLALDDPEAPEYVAQLVQNQLITPQLTLEDLRALPMSLLIHVARVWVRRVAIAKGEQNATTNSAEGLKEVVVAYLVGWQSQQLEALAPTIESLKRVTENLAPFMSQMVATYQQNVRLTLGSAAQSFADSLLPSRTVMETLRPALAQLRQVPIVPQTFLQSVGMLTSGLQQLGMRNALHELADSLSVRIPLFEQYAQRAAADVVAATTGRLSSIWARWLVEVEAAETVFADSGYGFADFLPISFIMASARRNPGTRHALVTMQLAAYLRSDRFAQELEALFARSNYLRRRWKSVAGGLQAHQQRDYQKSVLTWMREVEGLFKDLLVAMGKAKRTGETYIALQNGSVKYDSKGRPKILGGIGPAVEHAQFDATAPLYSVAETLRNGIRLDRNPIAHGARYQYQTAKLSVQGLLMIRMLAEEIVRLEGVP